MELGGLGYLTPKSTLDHQSTLDNRPPVDIQPRTEPSTWMSAITTQINALWRIVQKTRRTHPKKTRRNSLCGYRSEARS